MRHERKPSLSVQTRGVACRGSSNKRGFHSNFCTIFSAERIFSTLPPPLPPAAAGASQTAPQQLDRRGGVLGRKDALSLPSVRHNTAGETNQSRFSRSFFLRRITGPTRRHEARQWPLFFSSFIRIFVLKFLNTRHVAGPIVRPRDTRGGVWAKGTGAPEPTLVSLSHKTLSSTHNQSSSFFPWRALCFYFWFLSLHAVNENMSEHHQFRLSVVPRREAIISLAQ